MTATRHAAVAGSFYPDDPTELRAVVDAYLEDAGRHAGAGLAPKALIVPHAGFIYSGPVAARAYAALRSLDRHIERVVLVGPSHFAYIRGLAVPTVERFETPLGPVPLDRDAIESLRALPQVTVDDAPHRREHSLEVQLPFLQCTLGDFRLMPLAVGESTPAEVAGVLEMVWGGAETLIVISSDLSHYHDYYDAQALDRATADAIESGDIAHLNGEGACGFLGIAGLLTRCGALGLRLDRLDLRNSGDTAGPKAQVVGYGAWATQS